VQEIDAY